MERAMIFNTLKKPIFGLEDELAEENLEIFAESVREDILRNQEQGEIKFDNLNQIDK